MFGVPTPSPGCIMYSNAVCGDSTLYWPVVGNFITAVQTDCRFRYEAASPSLLHSCPLSLTPSIPHINLSPPSCTLPPPQVFSIFNHMPETPGVDPLPPSLPPHLIHFKPARNLPTKKNKNSEETFAFRHTLRG